MEGGARERFVGSYQRPEMCTSALRNIKGFVPNVQIYVHNCSFISAELMTTSSKSGTHPVGVKMVQTLS
jgi:hypothetical protein